MVDRHEGGSENRPGDWFAADSAVGGSAAGRAFGSPDGLRSAGAAPAAGRHKTAWRGTACRSAASPRGSSRSRPAVRRRTPTARPPSSRHCAPTDSLGWSGSILPFGRVARTHRGPMPHDFPADGLRFRAIAVRTVAPVGPRKPHRGSMATARSAILAGRSRTASASPPAATPCCPARKCQPYPPAAPAFMEGSASDRLRRPRPAPAPRKHFRRRSLAIGFAGHGQLRHRALAFQRLQRQPVRWENPPPDHVLTRLTLESRVRIPWVSTCPHLLVLGDQQTSDRSIRHRPNFGGVAQAPQRMEPLQPMLRPEQYQCRRHKTMFRVANPFYW